MTSRFRRTAHVHGEIQHRVVVITKHARGCQLVREFAEPALPASFSVVRAAHHPAKPAGDIIIHNDSSLAPMERKPRSRRIRPNTGESGELTGIFRWLPPIFRDDAGRLFQQGSTPVQAKRRRYLTNLLLGGSSECCRRRETVTKLAVRLGRLPGAGSLEQYLRHEGEPWI